MDNTILTMFSLLNYEKQMKQYPTDEMKQQMIREKADYVKKSLYQIIATIIIICTVYTLVKLVF